MNALDELLQILKSEGRSELANHIAILRYKASMWDKYQEEGRIDSAIAQLAAESGGGVKTTDEIMADLDPLLNPHAGDDFPNLATEFEPTKDASGHTYTGHDTEDVPGTARKGEN